MTRVVVLLRGVNVSGHKVVPMAQLRALAVEAGLTDASTYINSGNLIATASWKTEKAAMSGRAALETQLEDLVEARFGFRVPVIVRTQREWSAHAVSPPFADAITEHPNLVMLGVSQRPLSPDVLATLRGRASEGERVELHGGALVIDYAHGSARSKLTPTVLDRAAGSPVTTRNWRTLLKLCELLG